MKLCLVVNSRYCVNVLTFWNDLARPLLTLDTQGPAAGAKGPKL